MIGYRITLKRLKEKITAESADWLTRAAERTERFRTLGRFDEDSSIWSEVKVVFMRLQGEGKCVYCERKLESETFGAVEQDVEHFRPKGNVKTWKAPQSLTAEGISFTTVPNEDRGYFLLPYHPFNYSAACKPCNSVLKKDYFPIAGSYKLTGENPKKLLTEKPYLLYPVGDFDDDPERVIQFHGTSPQSAAATGHKRARALVTIEFFKLDDMAKRKNLFRERAMVVIALFPQLQALTGSGTPAEKAAAQALVDGFTSTKAAHTNCAKCFRRLFDANPAEAKAVFDKACQFILSIS